MNKLIMGKILHILNFILYSCKNVHVASVPREALKRVRLKELVSGPDREVGQQTSVK